MTSLKQAAQAYVPMRTKNIADLPLVSTEFEIFTENKKDSQGDTYTQNLVEINGERYRVPDIVLSDLKTILESKPDLKTFKVTKKGTGMNTTYTVIPMD